jgi:hypothetical protein
MRMFTETVDTECQDHWKKVAIVIAYWKESTMKRMSIIAVIALALTFLIVAFSQTPKPRPPINKPVTGNQSVDQAMKAENTVATQQRINRYFHGDVVPKLKDCWDRINGPGTIMFEYNYGRAGSRWTFQKVSVKNSSLPAGQNSVALKCMQDAVRSTSFAGEGAELKEKTFVLNWTWSVPFPADAEQLKTAMWGRRGSGGGGSSSGGCDGRGAAAACYNCKLESPVSCPKVCVGYQTCTADQNGCSMGGACASGGPFGVGGGGIAF